MRPVDTAIGIQHFLFDRVPSNIPAVLPKPRKMNSWLQDGKPVVAKTIAGGDVRKSVDEVLQLLGPLTKAISRGDRVLVKPNFNSADAPPASTDPAFLKVMIEILLETGAKVTVGESSGGIWRPTRNVFNRLHLAELTGKLGVKLISFDENPGDWVKIKIDGDYLHHVTMPRSAYEADKLIYLPCLKTHRLARYSGALKLAFGFVHPGERRAFHLSYREEKLAEISLCWQPDLIVVDGRKAFVTGGPQNGRIEKPNVFLASGDLIAVDVEAVNILSGYHAHNKLLADPWAFPQITAAQKHKLGAEKVGYILRQVLKNQ
jgi:uncharacterized protein (DUF362 family)